jgi:hypothetical protein
MGNSMFLKKDKRPNGCIYLSIVEGYREPETKKPKQRKVKSLGFLDNLEKNMFYQIEVMKNLLLDLR